MAKKLKDNLSIDSQVNFKFHTIATRLKEGEGLILKSKVNSHYKDIPLKVLYWKNKAFSIVQLQNQQCSALGLGDDISAPLYNDNTVSFTNSITLIKQVEENPQYLNSVKLKEIIS